MDPATNTATDELLEVLLSSVWYPLFGGGKEGEADGLDRVLLLTSTEGDKEVVDDERIRDDMGTPLTFCSITSDCANIDVKLTELDEEEEEAKMV